MPVLLSQVLATTRTFLNDDLATVWTDATLIPKIQEAHRELQTDLWIKGSPAVKAISPIIVVPVATTDLSALVPSDMINPMSIVEAPHGTTVYNPMTEVTFIPPGSVVGATLKIWAWQQEKVMVVGTNNVGGVDIIITYRRQITIPTLATDPVGILFGELYLAARATALAAGSVGNAEVLKFATETAKANFEKVLSANRGSQIPVNRP